MQARDAVASARNTLSPAGMEITAAGLEMYHVTPLGDPRVLILEEAGICNPDLIVLGSHGRHGLERLLLGSVAEAVAAHASCSVVVAR
jgi:universal stress protein A